MARKRKSYSYDEYEKAMKLLKSLGLTETCRVLGWPTTRAALLYYWKNGKHKPPMTKWIPQPSSELAYVLGVLHGDGSLYIDKMKYGYGYRIGLGVKDLEFAEIFSKNMARLLNRKYLLPKWNKSNNRWVVVYSSKAFYMWYKEQKLEMLKLFIEYSKDTVAYFLRGLYDGDGGHYKYTYSYKKIDRIHLSNNSLKLLKYVQYLLEKYFNIVARGPYIGTKAGAESKMRNGKIAKTNYNNYQITISKKQHVQRFLSEIGFSIEEKQLGLPRRK